LRLPKAEFIEFGSPKDFENIKEWIVDAGRATMLPSQSVRNVKVMMATVFAMSTTSRVSRKLATFSSTHWQKSLMI